MPATTDITDAHTLITDAVESLRGARETEDSFTEAERQGLNHALDRADRARSALAKTFPELAPPEPEPEPVVAEA